MDFLDFSLRTEERIIAPLKPRKESVYTFWTLELRSEQPGLFKVVIFYYGVLKADRNYNFLAYLARWPIFSSFRRN